MKVERNVEKDGIEIFFDDKPDTAMRDRMKVYKFRPTQRDGVWYWWAKYTHERWEFAVSLSGVSKLSMPGNVPALHESDTVPAVTPEDNAIADKVESAIAYLQQLLEEI